MRAVDVHLDAGLGLGLAVGVAAEVVAALEDQDLQAELVGAALGDGEAEEAGADDDEIGVRTRTRTRVKLLTCGRSGSVYGSRVGRLRIPRAARMARITLRASARPPRTGLSTTTAAVISHGLSRTSAFSPYRKWTTKRLRYM